MIRSQYFHYIEERLSTLATRIELRGKLNILDLHVHAEDFYVQFFNLLIGWHLENANHLSQNVAGIDLVDNTRRIVVQVSATATKEKVQSTLAKKALHGYEGHSFKFISISKDAAHLRSLTFDNPHSLIFAPHDDIYDVPRLLRYVMEMEITRQKEIAAFIRAELGTEIDASRTDSNLATIIGILAKEDWKEGEPLQAMRTFEIDRKITYNQLNAARSMVDDYGIHHMRVTRIYAEFDKQGANKSLTILEGMRRAYHRRAYHRNKSTEASDGIFFGIAEETIERIQNSANYVRMPIEELELCVNILVVDAFIRCKIFENPN